MQKEDDGFNNSEADGDPAAAFARVEDRLASVHGEVALLRAAIEGLTAARENIEIPDYEPTLERTEKILIALTQRIDPIAKSPLLSMTPDAMAGQIATAASGAYCNHCSAGVEPQRQRPASFPGTPAQPPCGGEREGR